MYFKYKTLFASQCLYGHAPFEILPCLWFAYQYDTDLALTKDIRDKANIKQADLGALQLIERTDFTHLNIEGIEKDLAGKQLKIFLYVSQAHPHDKQAQAHPHDKNELDLKILISRLLSFESLRFVILIDCVIDEDAAFSINELKDNGLTVLIIQSLSLLEREAMILFLGRVFNGLYQKESLALDRCVEEAIDELKMRQKTTVVEIDYQYNVKTKGWKLISKNNIAFRHLEGESKVYDKQYRTFVENLKNIRHAHNIMREDGREIPKQRLTIITISSNEIIKPHCWKPYNGNYIQDIIRSISGYLQKEANLRVPAVLGICGSCMEYVDKGNMILVENAIWIIDKNVWYSKDNEYIQMLKTMVKEARETTNTIANRLIITDMGISSETSENELMSRVSNAFQGWVKEMIN